MRDLAEALLYKVVNRERLEASQTTTFSFRSNDRTLPVSKMVSGFLPCRCLSACGFTALTRWRIVRFSAFIPTLGIVDKRCGEVLAAKNV